MRLLPDFLYPQSPFSDNIDSLITLGIDQTMRTHFDSALITFREVKHRNPRYPAGYFYEAAALQSRMMDLETGKWEEEFYRLVDEGISRADSLLESNETDAWVHFYRGSLLSYKGLYQAKSGKLVGGIVSARKGLGSLTRALELDSTLTEALLGLGSYKYWSGRFYRYLKWLPWISDEREEGIALVRQAARSSRFSRWVALNSLAWIEWDRGNLPQALRLFTRGLKRYPESRYFLWGLADTYFKAKRYTAAASFYQRILASVRSEAFNNHYNEVVCLVKLSYCALKNGENETAFKRADAALGLPLEKPERKRLQSLLKEAEDLRHQALEKLGRIKVIGRGGEPS